MDRSPVNEKLENAVAEITGASNDDESRLKRKRNRSPRLQTDLKSEDSDVKRNRSPRLQTDLKSEDSDVLLPPLLPGQPDKCTLVVDMDGTMLAEFYEPPQCPIDFTVEQISTGKRTFFSKRPGLENFLQQAAKLFEIVVFTESSKKRADVLLDMLQNRGCIAHRLYRESCTEIEGRLAKDLSRLGRDLNKVIIMDDCPFTYVLQRNNAIPMKWYNGDQSDRKLGKALRQLRKVRHLKDIRGALHNKYHRNEDRSATMNLAPLLPPLDPELSKTLVLDMDNTILQACSKMMHEDEGSEYFEVRLPGKNKKEYVYKRPDLDYFLTEMAKLFEIVVFTLSIKERADCFLDQIDRDRLIRFRLYRESSYSGIKHKRVKDLSRLGRDPRRVIIIDDNPISYEFQQTNAIPIKCFKGEKSDSELKQLIPFLQSLNDKEDVRPVISAKFDLDIHPVT